MRTRAGSVLLVATLTAALPLVTSHGTARGSTRSSAPAAATTARRAAPAITAPVGFEPNRGQFERGTLFLARGSGYSLALQAGGAVLTWSSAPLAGSGRPASSAAARPTSLRLTLVGANAVTRLQGRDRLPGTVSYYLGDEPRGWQSGIPTYARVQASAVYPGIDVIYHGDGSRLEYDVVVAPGAAVGAVRLAFAGAAAALDARGDLILRTGAGTVRQLRPVAYQEVGGTRRAVAVRYVAGPAHTVRFGLGAHDPRRAVVIDPVLSYATYAGKGNDDAYYSVATGASGDIYVTGATNSGFSHYMGFVSRYDATGTRLRYTTYIGGPCDSTVGDVALDAAGNAYLTGQYGAKNPNGFCVADLVGVQKLDGAGRIVYNHQFGNRNPLIQGNNVGNAIAVDAAGNAYVTGKVDADFPVTRGALQTDGHDHDGIVLKLNAAGKTVYATFLGGHNAFTGTPIDEGTDVAVDARGDVYVTGDTQDTDFPTTPTAYQPRAVGGLSDGFLVRLNPSGSRLLYATYLGGNASDIPQGLAVDRAGVAYVVGGTSSHTFPTTPDAFDRTCGTDGLCNPVNVCDLTCGLTPQDDAFLTVIDPARSGRTSLRYSTYLGGSTLDGANAVAVDGSGRVYVVGWTASPNFPTAHAVQRHLGGAKDAFLTVLRPGRSKALVFSTFLGGSADEIGIGIAADGKGNAYMAGYTKSSDFPTRHPLQGTYGGGPADGFLARIGGIG